MSLNRFNRIPLLFHEYIRLLPAVIKVVGQVHLNPEAGHGGQGRNTISAGELREVNKQK